jgi:hypothetical protein
MKKVKLLLLTIGCLSLTTCQKDHMLDCFKSTGDQITQTRDAAEITDIQLDDNVDLIIHPNSDPYIKVTAGENLIDGIITELSGNKLYIRNENRCNWMRSFKNTYTVEVGMHNPVSIVYYGSGDISCSDSVKTPDFHFDGTNGSGSINILLSCNRLFLNNHTGRCDYHLKGKCDAAMVYLNDVATCDARELNSGYFDVTSQTTGDVYANPLNELAVQILYNGNVYYSGSPVISSEKITGNGKLIHF